jgi:hypothetical protein
MRLKIIMNAIQTIMEVLQSDSGEGVEEFPRSTIADGNGLSLSAMMVRIMRRVFFLFWQLGAVS